MKTPTIDLASAAIVLKRMARKVKSQEECLVYVGAHNPAGYGKVVVEKRHWLAHRLMWTLVNGPIDDDLLVGHRCNNPPCVYIDHLFIGTR